LKQVACLTYIVCTVRVEHI